MQFLFYGVFTRTRRHQSGPSAGSTRINQQGHSLLRRLAYMAGHAL
ncbi:MAG: hypothetical protein OXU96_03625 [Gammaproteobacteria bacterium]|nr:hypothetical protein [Gammaproteobacteria bacterium]